MSVYVVTGKLGAGKTLVAVGRIRDYLFEGRKVATNLNLNLQNLVGYRSKKVRVTRLPDIPTIDDLNAIGQGYEGDYQGEHRNGLLVLDECGSFLNARDFNDKNRTGLRDWVIHARKKRWDVIFIIQHLEALDKQFRLMFAEHTVYCMRFDRVPIPFLTFFVKLITGFRLTFPKMHRGLVKYGSGQQAITVDTWWYRGTTLYSSYDTEQAFAPDDNQKNYDYLPPYYTHGVLYSRWDELKGKLTNAIKRFSITEKQLFFIGLIGGLGVSTYAGHLFSDEPPQQQQMEVKKNITSNVLHEERVTPQYYVVGKLELGNTTTYLFQDEEGRTAYPEANGYKIRPVHDCKVALIKKGQMTFAECPEPTGLDFMSEPVDSGLPDIPQNPQSEPELMSPDTPLSD